MKNQNSPRHHFKLFISTKSPSCAAIQSYLEDWVRCRDDIELEVIPVLESPDQLIHFGVNYTPALVFNGKVVSENCSISELKAFLKDFS